MGLFGTIFDGVKTKINEEKMKTEGIYWDDMGYSKDDEESFSHALDEAMRAQRNSKRMELMAHLKALEQLGKSEKVSESKLKREYNSIEGQVGGMVLQIMRIILCRRGLLRKEGDNYIKQW